MADSSYASHGGSAASELFMVQGMPISFGSHEVESLLAIAADSAQATRFDETVIAGRPREGTVALLPVARLPQARRLGSHRARGAHAGHAFIETDALTARSSVRTSPLPGASRRPTRFAPRLPSSRRSPRGEPRP